MEKIVKLEEFNWVSGRDAITIALCNTIIRKQNEIIDHLNSQDQKEENNFVHTVGTPMLESTTTCSQDTPEEWEDNKLLTDICNLLDRNGGYHVSLQIRNILVKFIQSLLDDREREGYEKGWDDCERFRILTDRQDEDYESLTGKERKELARIGKELDKLNNKKK